MNKKGINMGLVSLLMAVILIPQITFASWWNPFSWFGRDEQTTDIETLEELKAEVDELRTLVKFMQEELNIYHNSNIELLKISANLDKKTQDIAEAVYITADAGMELEKKVNSLWSWRWSNWSN